MSISPLILENDSSGEGPLTGFFLKKNYEKNITPVKNIHITRKKVWIMTLKVQFADIWPLSGHFLVLLVLEMDFDNSQSLLLSHHCALSRL